MALTKVTYVDGETVIEAENLNDIQDAIEELQGISEQTLKFRKVTVSASDRQNIGKPNLKSITFVAVSSSNQNLLKVLMCGNNYQQLQEAELSRSGAAFDAGFDDNANIILTNGSSTTAYTYTVFQC